MLLVAPIWAVLAIAGISLLLRWVKRRELKSYWGDARWGNSYERARRALVSLEAQSTTPELAPLHTGCRPAALELAVPGSRSMPAGCRATKGIVTLAQVEHGDIENRMRRRPRAGAGSPVCPGRRTRSILYRDRRGRPAVGITLLLQSHGIGNVRPNTVLFRWPDDADRVDLVADLVGTSRAFDCNVVAVRGGPYAAALGTREGPVDVWWHSRKNGALMLIFAHLITRTPAWRDRPVRLLHTVATGRARGNAARTGGVDRHVRIAAQAVVLVGMTWQQVFGASPATPPW